MKKKFKFFRSLRFRIMVILVIIGIVPSIIVEKGIVSSYEDRAVSLRSFNVKNQFDIIGNQLEKEGYLEDQSSEAINSQLAMLSNVYNGRILIVDQDYRVIKDTYDMDKGKYMISQEVVQCFSDGKETNHYDRENRYIELIVPIHSTVEEKTEVTGVMLISASTEEIAASIDILEQKGILILMIIMALVIGFGYILSGILMRPFAKVTKAIEDITDGFQDEQISVPDYTETELITDAFNKMLSRVKALDNSRQEFVSNVSHE